MNTCNYLRNTHDLSLSDWGPYARDFYGLSRVLDRKLGVKLDFFMVPGIFRRAFFPPETLRECGCSPWEASPELDYFMFRQQMEGKNHFYSDTAYAMISDDLWLGRIEFVNNTDELRANSLLLYTRLAPRDQVMPVMEENIRWIPALDYRELHYAYQRFDHNLTYNAGRRGEEQNYPGTVDGRCIGKPSYNRELPCFGAHCNDRVVWRFEALPHEEEILLRIRGEQGEKIVLNVSVNGDAAEVEFTATGRFELVSVFRGELSGTVEFCIGSASDGSGFRIDGFAVTCGSGRMDGITFAPVGMALAPCAEAGETPESTVFSFDGMQSCFISWHSEPEVTGREYRVRSLPELVNYSYGLRHPLYKTFGSNRENDEYCRDSYILPIEVPAHSSRVIYTLYGFADSKAAVNGLLSGFDRSPEALEKAFVNARRRAVSFSSDAGKKYHFSQQLMAAASLTNVNFPIQARGSNIRHHVPDKYFNSLYSWDSGFIGLGFLELDKKRAVENLNVYVTEPDDDENAFVFHGTIMPVQAYLYAEIWNRWQDRDVLEFFYPRLRRFYDFITGRIPSSTFASGKTGLLRPWDYFYNSGGWDDYPPQWYIFEKRRMEIAPVVTTAHAIRFAKILRQAACMLGYSEDVSVYDSDTEKFSDALMRYSYDKEEQIFSYVMHDSDGGFAGIFRDPETGVNFNLGMDGLSPLVAGICSPELENAMFSRLEDPEAMWTSAGLSTVDRRAPYYRTDGYWNGCVWMAHQWFFWKSALSAGRAEFARKIAETALDVWKNEVDQSFCCFEHFSISTGRGAGCCHFGGLSSPVLNWYGAYFAPSRLTGGFDCWINSQQQHPDGRYSAEVTLTGSGNGRSVVLFSAPDGRKRGVKFNGAEAEIRASLGHTIEIYLPSAGSGILEIVPLD